MIKLIEVCINCPNIEVAKEISNHLVERRLVACSNIQREIDSTYHWKGSIERTIEIPLLLKTRESLFKEIVNCVKDLHPYETPSIVGLVIDLVNDDYRKWIIKETGDSA